MIITFPRADRSVLDVRKKYIYCWSDNS